MTETAELFQPDMPIARLVLSKTNPRTRVGVDDADITELANSIGAKGVIQPLIVRQAKDGFEIVAGERRFVAAKKAGLQVVPVIVRSYRDDEVVELQLIENIQRRDLSPLDQAKSYRGLIDSNPTKHSAESIASRIGMSPQWVWDRLSLNNLIPEAKKLLQQERIAVGHAILIARQTPEHQESILDPDLGRHSALWQDEQNGLDFDDAAAHKKDKYHGLKARSVRELDHWITNHVRFDVEHAAKAQPFDFAETEAVVAGAMAQPGRGRKVVAITHEYRVADDARDEKERTYGSQSWERADGKEKSKTCEYSALGVVKAGPDRGQVLQVCVARDRCKVHFATEVKAREKREKERASRNAAPAKKATAGGQRSTEQLEKERLDAERQEWREQAWQKQKPEAVELFVKHVGKLKVTAALVKSVLDDKDYIDLVNSADVKRAFGVALTDKTAVQVLLLSTCSAHTFGEFEHFCDEVKPFGFKTTELAKAIDQAVKDAEAKAKPAAVAKPATKAKKGGTR